MPLMLLSHGGDRRRAGASLSAGADVESSGKFLSRLEIAKQEFNCGGGVGSDVENVCVGRLMLSRPNRISLVWDGRAWLASPAASAAEENTSIVL